MRAFIYAALLTTSYIPSKPLTRTLGPQDIMRYTDWEPD